MPKVARGDTQDTVTTNHDCTGSSTTAGKSSDVIAVSYTHLTLPTNREV